MSIRHLQKIVDHMEGEIVESLRFNSPEMGAWIEGNAILELENAYGHYKTSVICGFKDTDDFVESADVTRIFQYGRQVSIITTKYGIKDAAYFCVMADGASQMTYTFEVRQKGCGKISSNQYSYDDLLAMA